MVSEHTHESLAQEEQEAVEALLFRLADDEFVIAERYNEWAVFAPTLESDLAISNIAQDELGHARLYYDLLEDLGYSEAELLFDRPQGDFVHSTLVELPFTAGDWADTVVRGYFYDTAEAIQLESLTESSYLPLAERIPIIQDEETYHREHTQNWLDELASVPEGRERVQAAVARLYPHARTLFAAGDAPVETFDRFGLTSRSLSDMEAEWEKTVDSYLSSIGLDVPTESDRADALGRDRTHTDGWDDLYEEFTSIYRNLDKPEPKKIMEEK